MLLLDNFAANIEACVAAMAPLLCLILFPINAAKFDTNFSNAAARPFLKSSKAKLRAIFLSSCWGVKITCTGCKSLISLFANAKNVTNSLQEFKTIASAYYYAPQTGPVIKLKISLKRDSWLSRGKK
ncbi:hypothetical protein ACU8KH_03440 [Lachancea thermotolerans]